jgi:hypothetical protein
MKVGKDPTISYNRKLVRGAVLSLRRTSVLAGFLVALSLCLLGLQGATQEAKTQTEGEDGDPTYQEGTRQAFASGEIIVKLADDASQADLRDLNQ